MMERVDCDGGVAGVMEVAAADGAERARVSELEGGGAEGSDAVEMVDTAGSVAFAERVEVAEIVSARRRRTWRMV